jgi:hypothetical protein
MKTTGLIIFAVGLIMTALTGFDLMTREKLIDIGRLEITTQKRHIFDWSPLPCVGIIALGAGVYLLAGKHITQITLPQAKL